jgi:hypothetical protein
VLDRVRVSLEDVVSRLLHLGKKIGIEYDAVFDDLGQPAVEFTHRQRAKCGQIDEDAGGLVKCADQIL